jgi:glycosyltransferase involved in cell wall biosynthesis
MAMGNAAGSSVMKILFCSEFYAPSVGGVQEVIRQLAERLVEKGHQVTIATSKLPNRNFTSLNGVNIKEFSVSGNLVRGMFGDEDKYRQYIIGGDFDVLMIKAAQQWTFDALWPVLEQIKIPKVFIPCGFSGLMEPAYANYFTKMPEVLRKFDHLIFYASDYRDINFTKQHGISNFSIIPNGASEKEFNAKKDATFRLRNDIPENAFVFLTVGSLTGLKGHLELAQAFNKLTLKSDENAVLILNGNDCLRLDNSLLSLPRKFTSLLLTYGIYYTARHTLKGLLRRLGIAVGKSVGIHNIAMTINKSEKNKKILVANFPRTELIQAYMASDLFVFASNIEYSPLVLFESAAAGIPFLSVNVGNSVEIANWTQSGEICPSDRDEKGYTRVSTDVLAGKMEEMMSDVARLKEMGARGKRNWSERFTWHKIATQYENIFEKLVGKNL